MNLQQIIEIFKKQKCIIFVTNEGAGVDVYALPLINSFYLKQNYFTKFDNTRNQYRLNNKIGLKRQLVKGYSAHLCTLEAWKQAIKEYRTAHNKSAHAYTAGDHAERVICELLGLEWRGRSGEKYDVYYEGVYHEVKCMVQCNPRWGEPDDHGCRELVLWH